MPRDPRKVEKREIKPDIRYNSLLVSKFINKTMRRGKKQLATRLVYGAMNIIKERTKKNELEIFEQAIKNVTPVIEVKSRRIGGANYQVPVEVRGSRKTHLAINWVLDSVKEKKGKSFDKCLAEELIDAHENKGGAIKKKETVQKMAEANRAFAHLARY